MKRHNTLSAALRKGLSALGVLFRDPTRLQAVLHDNRYWQGRFKKKYGHSNGLPTVPIEYFLPQTAELGKYTFLGGGSMVTDLLVLKSLAQRQDVGTYFEIGRWRGESLAAVSPHVEIACSLDLSETEMQDRGYPPAVIEQMGSLIEGLPNVRLLEGDARHFDFSGMGIMADLIFIDGAHDYAHVLSDTKNVAAHLMHETSVVVWHDYAYHPENLRYEVYTAMLDGLPAELHRHLYQISHTQCAILLRDYPGTSFPETEANDRRRYFMVTVKDSKGR